MEQPLKNKTAIVTGASDGFGAGIAKALINAGAKVWIIARGKDKLEKIAGEIGANSFCGDVTNSEDWDLIVSSVMHDSEKVDILINNAGGGISIKEITDQKDEDIINSISLNLTSAILGSKRIAQIMKEQKEGIIIQISSICSRQCWPGWGIYGAAKAGLEQFSRGLYTEMRPHGVRAVCITPSWGATGFANAAQLPIAGDEDRRKMISPDDMGQIVIKICTTPRHLVIPEITILPLIQEIIPY